MAHTLRLTITQAAVALMSVIGCLTPAPCAVAQDISITPSTTTPPAPAPWPRTFAKGGSTLVMYAPQIDSWEDHSKIKFRMAIALTEAGNPTTHYGVVAARADTYIDDEARTVLFTGMDIAVRFPGTTNDQSSRLKALANDCLPKMTFLDLSLDEVTAYLHDDAKVKPVDVNLNPPPMYYSDGAAILVVYMGQPKFKPITGTQLQFAVNTNWVVLMNAVSGQYFLLSGDSWYTSTDPLNGPWTAVAAGGLPAEFSDLPTDGNWADVKKHIPGTPATSVPRVLASTEPAELILTDGPPNYSPIDGTRLMYVSNPPMPLFLDLADTKYYYMVAGRWFRAGDVTGPWSPASSDLPAEFAKIPSASPMGYVLASVPGTQQARDAVILSSIPHKATLTVADAKLNVTYEGAPSYAPITGTQMSYAVNSSYQVIRTPDQLYYCCFQGAWFTAPAATGPWVLCTSVPQVIYTIPSSSPLYNVTYVQVYSSTPTTVVVGYTGGYSGEYVASTGALMFGAGMLTGAILASNNDCWYGYNPCYYSYGCAAHYSYACGGYYRAGGSCYGPYGGAGWGSAYNPATGTWARGGAAYGPNGAHYGAQAYNPWTNTYAQHTGGSNGYKSWGSSYVQQGNSWAEGAHQSNAAGSAGWAENSSGQSAAGVHSNVTNTTVAKTSNGDVYAGHDGNIYKKSDGSWSQYQGNGNWQDTSWNKSPSASTSSAAAESNWQNTAQNRSASNSTSNWNTASSGDSWKSNWESGGGSGSDSAWGQHDTQQSLNRDSYSRSSGEQNAQSSWQSRSSGGWGGGGGGGWGGRSGGWGGGGGWGGRRR